MATPTKPKYLTKSRFKKGLECPTKLYYGAKNEYVNTQEDDTFLQALADGGYQVGELAKLYYPTGTDVNTLEYTEALEQTGELLESASATVFEAAINVDDLFIRIDILEKKDNHFNLIEVKAKSIDPADPEIMRKDGKGLTASWKPYLQDIAFQRYVLSKAYPGSTINCYLMLVDKTAIAGTDGINTRFRIVKHGDTAKSIDMDVDIQPADLEPRLLTLINADVPVNMIQNKLKIDDQSFEEKIHHLATLYKHDEREQGPLGKHCLKCEFRSDEPAVPDGTLSGYHECWRNVLNWTDADFEMPTVLNIWDLRKADQLMQDGKLQLDTITKEDLKVAQQDTPGMSRTERQWIQTVKARKGDTEPYFDTAGFKAEMHTWQYPLHFIDFETTTPALPFTRGLKPYETVAFQFSHHVMYEDGSVVHKGEFLDTTPGNFPNLDFVRELKRQLSEDKGTVFRFHNHENTVLVGILYQLQNYTLTDENETEELSAFITELTHSTKNSTSKWVGSRDMVDLYALGLRYYYHPATGGRNSLKALLPALISSSSYLQNKYGAPTYGSPDGIPSLNFKGWKWIDKEQDPYSTLKPMFEGYDPEELDALVSQVDRIAEGGAAMTAYGSLQFVEMGDNERVAMNKALLKYCELDTLTMVMVVEAWRDMLS